MTDDGSVGRQAFVTELLREELDAVITGVADYGFFGQAEQLPVEGLVHVSTLPDDYYYYEETTHSLTGRRSGRRCSEPWGWALSGT